MSLLLTLNIFCSSASIANFEHVIERWKNPNTRFFYKQHLYTQRQAKIDKKIKQKLSNTLRLNFRYLKIIHFLHPRYHPKIIGDTLKNVSKTSASVLMGLHD